MTSTPETKTEPAAAPAPAAKLNRGRGRGKQRAGTGALGDKLLGSGQQAEPSIGEPVEPIYEKEPRRRVPPQASPATRADAAPEAQAEPDEAEEEPRPRVPPQAPPTAAVEHSVVDRQAEDDEEPGWISPTVRSGSGERTEQLDPGEDGAEVSFQTSIYITGADIPRAKKYARIERITHAALLMDAIDAALDVDVLRELVAADRTTSRPEASRFPARRGARPRGGQTDDKGSLLPVQMTQTQLDVLDDLVGELAASSRSSLSRAAIGWYLKTPKVRRALERASR